MGDRLKETQDNENLNTEDGGNIITSTFVPTLPLFQHEEFAIKNVLNRVQSEARPIEWPQINNNPINEFQTPGYIACAFPTLYPTGCADL